MCQGLELWWQAAPSLQALQENVLCEPKMILLSLFKRWGVHHRSSGRSRVLWTSGQCGVRAGHKKWSMPWKNFKPFNLFPFLMRQKKENLGIFFFFPCKMSWRTSFLPDAVCNVGNIFRVGIWTWTSRHSWVCDHQAVGESGLASSVFPLAIQATHPRSKILAMAFLEQKPCLCESFNGIIIFWSTGVLMNSFCWRF